jgi:hypothetical protein
MNIKVGEIIDGIIEDQRGLFLRVYGGVVNLLRPNFTWDLSKSPGLTIEVYQRNVPVTLIAQTKYIQLKQK